MDRPCLCSCVISTVRDFVRDIEDPCYGYVQIRVSSDFTGDDSIDIVRGRNTAHQIKRRITSIYVNVTHNIGNIHVIELEHGTGRINDCDVPVRTH